MNQRTLVAAILMIVLSVTVCQADTLVITYRSGKTQTVTLDEPSTTINSWQFVGGVSAVQPQQQVVPDAPRPAAVKEQVQPVEKPAEKKSNVRVQWNAKPISD